MKLEAVLVLSDRAAAYIELVSLYFNGTDCTREHIIDKWDFGVGWSVPNQARLACRRRERWSCLQRIEASLAYSAIAAKHSIDFREELIALAVIYQSCIYAELDPKEVFGKIAKVSPPSVKSFILDFLLRKEEDKTLAAFFLLAKQNNDGEIEIVLNI